MRVNIKTLFSIVLLVVALVIPSLSTQAGKTMKSFDATTYESGLSASEWYNADNDIVAEKGIIRFPSDSTASTKLVSKAEVRPSSQMEDAFSAEFQLKFNALPEGEEFVVAMGLASMQAGLGEKGNIELSFSNNGGTTNASLTVYPESGEKTVLANAVSVGKGIVTVQINMTSKQTLKVTAGGKQIYNGKISVDGSGRFGFLQTGSCEVELSKLNVKLYEYDTPEAPSFTEDFETGYFNSNVLLSTALLKSKYAPSSITIQDYKGTKALAFQNAGSSYFGTKYAYSNFELTFDVLYSQNKPLLDEEGVTLSPVTDAFGLAYGSDGINHTSYKGYTSAANMFVIAHSAGTYCIQKVGNTATDKFKSQDGTFSVKLSVVDGQVSLSFRPLDGGAYTEVYSYKHETTPCGNIIFWVPDGCVGTWTIDNFKIVNKDVDGNDFEVEYKSSEIEKPDDFAYEPLGYNYNPNRVTEEDTSDSNPISYPIIIGVTGVCILALVITVIVRARKRKNKGGADHEK